MSGWNVGTGRGVRFVARLVEAVSARTCSWAVPVIVVVIVVFVVQVQVFLLVLDLLCALFCRRVVSGSKDRVLGVTSGRSEYSVGSVLRATGD